MVKEFSLDKFSDIFRPSKKYCVDWNIINQTYFAIQRIIYPKILYKFPNYQIPFSVTPRSRK